MKNQFYLNLKPDQFQRRFGVKIETLNAMVSALENFKSENQKDKRGRRTILTLSEQVLGSLEYWR